MSHSESVCTLCWELLSSDSFFSSADSEKEDMGPGLLRPRGGRGAASPTTTRRGRHHKMAARALTPPRGEGRHRTERRREPGRTAGELGACATITDACVLRALAIFLTQRLPRPAGALWR